MIRYLKAIRSLFSKKELEPEIEEIDAQAEEFISDDDCSANIEIRLNRVSGDFNVVVSVQDLDDETADTLGLLLFLINSGNLKEYFTEAYGNWAYSDGARTTFLHNMYLKWLGAEESFTDEYDKLAVKPSNVFGLNSPTD
tara:strand:+ start:60 stop:479 length:420 start_codon:yes stop_codon:yes gene_type:complete